MNCKLILFITEMISLTKFLVHLRLRSGSPSLIEQRHQRVFPQKRPIHQKKPRLHHHRKETYSKSSKTRILIVYDLKNAIILPEK